MNDQDDCLAVLRYRWGRRWQFWTVQRYIGGTLWCARLHDNHKRVINADSAEQLEKRLREADQGPPA
jgi:hypothetical protein